MIDIFRGYVRTIEKKPIQKFKGVNNLLSFEDVKNLKEYAGILNGDFTVMDIDNADEAKRALNIVLEANLNCRVVKTSRGMHFIFANNSKFNLKGNTHKVNSLGLTIDIRSGENQYIIVKYDNKVRQIIRDFDESRPLTEYPKFFAPMRYSDKKIVGLSDGDGRNGLLYSYLPTLMNNGFTKEECREICIWINNYIFDEPLENNEIETILRDESFENINVSSAINDFGCLSYKPLEYSDNAMAQKYAEFYKDEVRFSSGLGWVVFDGVYWKLNELDAQAKVMDFVTKVLADAKAKLVEARAKYDPKSAELKPHEEYYKFALKMCDASHIFAIHKLAKAYLSIDTSVFDKNQFELNTPAGIVDLRDGTIRVQEPSSYCTKVTNVSPSTEGGKMWQELLELVTLGNKEYQKFLQVLCGTILIGKVYNEALIIAQGGGQNGKSTFFNTIFDVLGTYSGKIPAESLTTRAKSIKVDLAELFGKRFILASETEEGQRLSNQMLKQIASTDVITAERKYCHPFIFTPTHTALLYTNFLPSLGSLDGGTKRRLIICPFNAVIKNPQKDYAEKLLKEDGGYILNWLIEGAKNFIASNYNLPPCKVCDTAKGEYIEANDWLQRFVDDCCIVDENESQSGGILYKAYQQWCKDTGEFCKRNRDFASALASNGFTNKRTKKCVKWEGLALDPERTIAKIPNEDFL